MNRLPRSAPVVFILLLAGGVAAGCGGGAAGGDAGSDAARSDAADRPDGADVLRAIDVAGGDEAPAATTDAPDARADGFEVADGGGDAVAADTPPDIAPAVGDARDAAPDVAAAPDGPRDARDAGAAPDSTGGEILARVEDLPCRDFGAMPSQISFTPDGQVMLTVNEGSVILRPTSDWTARRIFPSPAGSIKAAAVAPDGLTAASGGTDKLIRFWRISDAAATTDGTLAMGEAVTALAISRDGASLAAGDAAGNLALFDLQRREARWNVKVRTEAIALTAFTTSGNVVVMGQGQGTVEPAQRAVELRAGADGASLRTVVDPAGARVTFSDDGTTAVVSAPGGIRLWPLGDTAQPARTLTIYGTLARLSPDNQTLASVPTTGGGIDLWDLKTSTRTAHLTLPAAVVDPRFTPEPSTLAFSPDGKRLAGTVAGRGHFVLGIPGGAVQLSEVAGAGAPSFSPAGRAVAFYGGGRLAQSWDYGEGRRTQLFPEGGAGGVLGVWFVPGGQLMVAGGQSASFWTPGAGAPTRTVTLADVAPSDGFGEVTLSSDAALVAGAAGAGVRLWRLSDGAAVTTIAGGGQRGRFAFSPDGTLVATATGLEVTLRRTSDWATVRTVTVESIYPTPEVWGLQFSPDGALLAVSTRDHVFLVRVASGGVARVFDAPYINSQTLSVAFSPDGARLAVAVQLYGADTARTHVMIWQVADGTLSRTLVSGGEFAGDCLVWSPDGRAIAACAQGPVRLWCLDPADR